MSIPKKFTLDPESRMVLMTWGNEKKRTIEEDVARLGLTTKGYQPDMDDWVKDGLMARAMERLNRIFWRNPDGTPIPGVSFNITFGMELPKGAKGHKVWTTIVAGDDPRAGGRASAPYAFTFSSFLVRTMYLKRRLKQPLHYPDYKYFNGKYKWGSSLEENLRHDNIRSLIEGFSGAIALTTAHECGHLAGLGHDTQTPRSIMNVAEGGGLHPDYAEWVPPHIKTLDRGLKRVPAPRK